MYFKNGRLFENFIVEEKTQTLDKSGRPKTNFEFKATGEIIRGVIANAKASEIEKWKESQHLITHTILQKLGKIKAKSGDRLVNGSRFFYVVGVDDVAMRGYFILYYVEERNDAN